MKKHLGLTVLTALILLIGCMGFAQAEIIPPQGEGQIGIQAVVLYDGLPVYKEADAASKEVNTLHFGDIIILQQQQEDGWAVCFLSDAEGTGPAGWVNTAYLAVDTAWYFTDAETPVYAWNDTAAPQLTLLDASTILPVLKVEDDWLVVSLPGMVGWIHR